MDSTLVIKNSYTYCKNLQVIKAKYYAHAPRGDRLVGKDHRWSPTATHKEDNQKVNPAPTSSHNSSPCVHATGITNFNTSISQIHNYSTSTTLISLPPCLKKSIKLLLVFKTLIRKFLLFLNTKHIRII